MEFLLENLVSLLYTATIMKNKFLVALLALCGTLGPLSAENLTLDYVDGTVELRMKGDAWQALDVGAVLTPESVIRISDNGVAELSAGKVKIHLGKNGTFQLSNSLAMSQKKTDSNLLGLTNKQVGMLLGTGVHNGVNVANMGARGAAKGSDEGMAWASDDAAATVDPEISIQAKMDQRDWAGALANADQALAANPADPQALLFDKAVILSQMGRAAGSLKALKQADFQQGETRYFEATLLMGTQGIETEDYDLVLAKTDEALSLQPEKGVLQSLTLAQALAWKGKGDDTKAVALLNAVVKMEPQSGAGIEAARLLGN